MFPCRHPSSPAVEYCLGRQRLSQEFQTSTGTQGAGHGRPLGRQGWQVHVLIKEIYSMINRVLTDWGFYRRTEDLVLEEQIDWGSNHCERNKPKDFLHVFL